MKVRSVDGNEPTSKDLDTHKVAETVKKDGMTVKSLEVDPIKDNLISREQQIQSMYQDERGHNKITMKMKPKPKAVPEKEIVAPSNIEEVSKEEEAEMLQKRLEQQKQENEARIQKAKEEVEKMKALDDRSKLINIIKTDYPELDESEVDFILDDEYTIKSDEQWAKDGIIGAERNQQNSIRFKKTMQRYNETLDGYIKSVEQSGNKALKDIQAEMAPKPVKEEKVQQKPQNEATEPVSEATSEDSSEELKAMRKELEMLRKEVKGELEYTVKVPESDEYKFKLSDKTNTKKRGAADHWKDAQEASEKFDDPWKGRRTTNTSWKPGDRIASIKTDDGDVKISG